MHKVDAHLNQTVAFESACQVNMPSDAGVPSLSLAQTVLSSVCKSVDQALHPNASASSNGTAQSKCTECSEEAARLHEYAANHCSYWPLVQEGICEQVSMEDQYAQTLQGLSSKIKHILAEIEETGIASEADLDSKDKAIQKIVSDTVSIRAQLDETLTQIREGLTRTSTASGAGITQNGSEHSKKYKTASQTLDMIGASAASLKEAESRAIVRNVRAEKDLQQCLQDRAEAEGSGASSVFSEYPTEEHTTTEYQPGTVGQKDEEQTDTSTPVPQQTVTAEETPTPPPQEPSISGTAATSLDDLPENKTEASNMPELHNEPSDSRGKEPEANKSPFNETLISEGPAVSDNPAHIEKTSPIEELPEINSPRTEALISEEKSSSETPATSKSSLASSLDTPTEPNITPTETTISSEPAITSTEHTTPTETNIPTENNIVSSDPTTPTETNVAFTEKTISNEPTTPTETNINSTDPTILTEPNIIPTEPNISDESTLLTETNIAFTDPTILTETTTSTEPNIVSSEPTLLIETTTPTETIISNEPTAPTETTISSNPTAPTETNIPTETTIPTEPNISGESTPLTETNSTPTEPAITSSDPILPTETTTPAETTTPSEPTTAEPITTFAKTPTATPSTPVKDVSPSLNSTAQNSSEASAIEDPALQKARKPNRRKKIFNNPLKFKKLPQINRTANEGNIF
ncbi:hypothetical protein NERG_02700 [Nematocida ausubeli]|uniref:Uncharacterized protein n=1 Tax=Nematocida ausubeli (strain ATCC PRA-371 / ERTm2) TaxID=1913371 RepID=H8ZGH9_NEMA1|nr:hypothetical protein NERG_02700 [Nematocida ausubeli]